MIKLSNLIYMAIALSMIVFGMLSWIGGLSSSYSKTPDLQSLNKTVQLGTQIKTNYQEFQTDQPSTSFLGSSGILITGANVIWKFILTFLQLPESIVSMIVDFLSIMGVPGEFIGGVYLWIIAGTILAVIYILSKVEP